MVVRDGVDGAVGVARVVDEAGGAAQVHAVAHVLRASFFLGPFVESHQVYLLVSGACLASTVGFLVSDDFAAVGVDELASL